MTSPFPVYLDYAATTPVDQRVVDAMIPWLREHFGNAASRSHEIDLAYPPDRIEFYEFLEGVVTESIAWLRHAAQVVESGISFHTQESVEELGAIAGKTNFDLKNDSELEYSPEEKEPVIRDAIEKLREIGADEQVIRYLESKI